MLTNNLSISNYRFTVYKEVARSGRVHHLLKAPTTLDFQRYQRVLQSQFTVNRHIMCMSL